MLFKKPVVNDRVTGDDRTVQLEGNLTKTCGWQAKNVVNMPHICAGARKGKYPDIRHLVIKNKLLLTSLQLEFLSIASNLYLIPFHDTSICFPVAIVHAHIINNNINIVGTNNKGCETGAMGVIHSQSQLHFFLYRNTS